MLQVVDPHVHFWSPAALHYPWLAEPRLTFMGDHSSLAREHGPAEFLRAAEGVDVLKVVHVEAGHDPADPVAETAWVQALAGPCGMPHGIVAYADLSSPGAGHVLARQAAHPGVRGIRQILNVHPDPLHDYVGRHFMREPAWQAGFALLERHGLSFDLQLYPGQMPEAAALARAHPGTGLVVNHAGMFVDRGGVAGWRAWRDGLRTLAACPNVSVKISGFGMIDHRWTVEGIRPYVLELVDAFGVDRAMFASNFPVDGLYGSYAGVWHAFAETVRDATATERAALFRETAERVYRI